MKHIIIYLAIALVMFGLLGWYFAQQEDLQPKALQAELSVSNVAKLPQQKVEMLFSDMSNEEKNSFRIAIQNELGAAVDVAAHDCMGSAEVQMTYAKKVLEQGCTVLMLEPVNDTVTDELLALAQEYAKQGKALIVSPDDTCGVDTLKKNKSSLQRLYEKGYKDGEKISNYLYNER